METEDLQITLRRGSEIVTVRLWDVQEVQGISSSSGCCKMHLSIYLNKEGENNIFRLAKEMTRQTRRTQLLLRL